MLPREFFDTESLDTQLRQWVALPIIVAVGYALGVLVTSLGLRLCGDGRTSWRRY